MSQVGKIIDIGLGGLSFEFLSTEKATTTTPHVDLFTLDEEYTLSGLPCLLVYQSAAPIPGVKGDAANGFMIRRCGLKYEGLNGEQWGKIAAFLENNTIREPAPEGSSPDDTADDQEK